jgi:hypothetical protein
MFVHLSGERLHLAVCKLDATAKRKKVAGETTFFAIIHLIQYTQKTQTRLSVPEQKYLSFHLSCSTFSVNTSACVFPNAVPINL